MLAADGMAVAVSIRGSRFPHGVATAQGVADIHNEVMGGRPMNIHQKRVSGMGHGVPERRMLAAACAAAWLFAMPARAAFAQEAQGTQQQAPDDQATQAKPSQEAAAAGPPVQYGGGERHQRQHPEFAGDEEELQ